METHIEGTMYGDFYIGFNIWRLTYRVQYMEISLMVTMFGDSYRV